MTVENRGRCSLTFRPGCGRGDRLELAADPVGRVRLHVEGVDVRGAAELVQEEDVLRPRAQPRPLGGPQPGGQVQPGEPRGAGLEQVRRESAAARKS